MAGFILYSCGVLLVGFIGGIMTKHIIDKDAIRQVCIKNRAMRSEIEFLKRLNEDKVKEREPMVIEIKDETLPQKVHIGGF